MTADRAAEILSGRGLRFDRAQLCTSGRLWFAYAVRADGETVSGRGLTSEDACANLVVVALSGAQRGAA